MDNIQTFDEKVLIEAEKYLRNQNIGRQYTQPGFPSYEAVFTAGAAFAKKEFESKDGEVCPACATEWEKGDMKLCGGTIIKEAVALRAQLAKKELLEEKMDILCSLFDTPLSAFGGKTALEFAREHGTDGVRATLRRMGYHNPLEQQLAEKDTETKRSVKRGKRST